jgi:hypothetical protein
MSPEYFSISRRNADSTRESIVPTADQEALGTAQSYHERIVSLTKSIAGELLSRDLPSFYDPSASEWYRGIPKCVYNPCYSQYVGPNPHPTTVGVNRFNRRNESLLYLTNDIKSIKNEIFTSDDKVIRMQKFRFKKTLRIANFVDDPNINTNLSNHFFDSERPQENMLPYQIIQSHKNDLCVLNHHFYFAINHSICDRLKDLDFDGLVTPGAHAKTHRKYINMVLWGTAIKAEKLDEYYDGISFDYE